MNTTNPQDIKPTIVLVHGAFAESSSWNGVLTQLHEKGYPTVAGANPLRGVKSNADYVFPGSTLGPALTPPVATPDGGNDLYIQQDKFHAQFAADVPIAAAQLMASTQRPIAETALNEASGTPAWQFIPSWFIYGDRDLNIPEAALSFMAERANSKETVVVSGDPMS